MKLLSLSVCLAALSSVDAFAPSSLYLSRSYHVINDNPSSSTSSLNVVKNDDGIDVADRLKLTFTNAPDPNAELDTVVQDNFPGALTNVDLVTNIVNHLSNKDYTPSNTLLATSLCCDELARQLEDDLNGIYGNNFNLGGLAGFPFAGKTGFGNMAIHIPDDGHCLLVYGPHVGLAADGTIGKVERAGIELIDNCCASAIAASKYVKSITDGNAPVTTTMFQDFFDFQQGAVQELILPHGRRLAAAESKGEGGEHCNLRMKELPKALFESQDLLVRDIIQNSSRGIKKDLALLGGIQINTGPETLDYFLPLRFDLIDNSGEVLEDMLTSI